ncbi:MAG: hypothetical protein HY794_16725 [Desulfarculus sp.]|nr:hypothetical protein [Desulfarculus sp.]
MGLIKGTATYTRYKVQGECDLRAAFEAGVRAQIFRGIEHTTEEYDSGWVRPDDWLRADVDYASCVQEPYVILGLRADRRRIKGPVMKKELRLAMDNWREEHPDEPLGRVRRNDIKDRVRLELLRRLPPEPTLAEVIWNTKTGEVWVGTQAEKALGMFETKFRASFGLGVCPRLPLLLGMDLLGDDKRCARLCEAYGVQPFLLPDAPPVAILEQPSRWLMQDYLTWLWATADTKGGLDMGDLGAASIRLGTEMRLAPKDGMPGSSMALTAGHEQTLEDEDLAEAFEALDAGKRPTRASFTLTTEGLSLGVSLRAAASGPANLTLPPTEASKGKDAEWWGAALERVYLIEQAQGLLDGLLFAWLLAARTSPQARAKADKAIAGWINDRRAGAGNFKPSTKTKAAAQRLVDSVKPGSSLTITTGDGKGVHIERPASGGPAKVSKAEGQEVNA